MTANPNDNTKDKKGKSWLSSLRHSDKEKEKEKEKDKLTTATGGLEGHNQPVHDQSTHNNPVGTHNQPIHNQTLHNNPTTHNAGPASYNPLAHNGQFGHHETGGDDSTYGGSSTRDSHSGSIPTISNAQAAEQNAPITTRTDKATGRTIVTTTTTTTTTVTTVDGDQYQVPAGQEVQVSETKKETGPVELSAHPGTPGVHTADRQDPLAAGGVAPRTRTPSPPPPPPAAVIERYGGAQARDSPTGGDSPVSPIRTSHNNFSYPARTPNSQASTPQQYPNQQSTGYGPHSQPLAHGSIMHPPQQQGQPVSSNSSSTYFNQPGGQQQQGQQQSRIHPQRSYYDEVPHDPEPTQSTSTAPFQQLGEQPGHPGYNNVQSQTQAGQPQRMGTLAGLKAAAAGIHGAGETLRGTLNSSLDRRTGGDPARIAANDAIAQRGMQEIQTRQFADKRHYGPPSERLQHQGQAPAQAHQDHLGAQQQQHAPELRQHTPLGQQQGPLSQHPPPLGQHPPQGQQTPLGQQIASGPQGQLPPGGRPGQRYDPLEGTWVQDEPVEGQGAEKKKGGLRNVLRRKEVGGQR